MKRRELVKYISMAPLGGVGLTGLAAAQDGMPTSNFKGRDLLGELGVRVFINAAGTYTSMTASLMRPETIEAIRQTSQHFVMIDELQDKVGERIAAITHAEAAVVTSGAFAALTLGMAGILTGTDPARVKALPKLEGTGMKSEVICQKGHAMGYNQALTNTGCKMIVVETEDDVRKAINERTAALHFINILEEQGQIKADRWVAIAKEYKIPATIDIAADVPPVSNLWRFNELGYSFVAISGGKALRGPQSAGLLLGKKEVIQAARLSMFPRGETIGRGMKVNKEEIVGMWVALEEFVKTDFTAFAAKCQKSIDMFDAVAKAAGAKTRVFTPVLGNVTPTLDITIDKAVFKKTADEIRTDLMHGGDPGVAVVGGASNLGMTAWCLKDGEDKIVAKRLKEVLEAAKA